MQSAIVSVLLAGVYADIPVHCEMADMTRTVKQGKQTDKIATWVVRRTKPVPATESLMSKTGETLVPKFQGGDWGAEKYCGLSTPNRNSENVKLDLPKLLEGQDLDEFKLQLTEERVQRPGPAPHVEFLKVKCMDDACHVHHNGGTKDGQVKHQAWVSAYDEGAELRMHHNGNDIRYLFFSKYKCLPGSENCNDDSVGESEDGHTRGFQSYCGESLAGWYHSPEGHGCFHAFKEDEESRNHPHVVFSETVKHPDKPSSFVEVQTVYRKEDFEGDEKRWDMKAESGDFDIMTYKDFLKYHEDNQDRHEFKVDTRSSGVKRYTQRTMKFPDTCAANNEIYRDYINGLFKKHRTFSLREDRYRGKWDTSVRDQGACGSCYTMSLVYALESRANLQLLNSRVEAVKNKMASAKGQQSLLEMNTTLDAVLRDVENSYKPFELSAEATLPCMHFNQACSGGYPLTAAMSAHQFGFLEKSCVGEDFNSHSQRCPTQQGSCYADPEQKRVVKALPDYNYVGGRERAWCGIAHIMAGLVEHGPVVGALEVPGDFNRGKNDIAGDELFESYLQKGGYAPLPEKHHKHGIEPGANIVEARWALKQEAQTGGSSFAETSAAAAPCPNKHEDQSAMDTLSQAMEKDPAYGQGYGKERSPHRFTLDTTLIPERTNLFAHARSLISTALDVHPNCVHVEFVDLADQTWEYTNHAIVLTGWGVHKEHPPAMRSRKEGFTMRNSANSILQFEADERPYWIIRNSWGTGYGDRGEGFAAMGIGYAGLESGQALHIQADPSYGLLKHKYAEPVKDRHGNVLVESVTPVSFPPALESETDPHEAKEAAVQSPGNYGSSIIQNFMNYIQTSTAAHASFNETASNVSESEPEEEEVSIIGADGDVMNANHVSSVRVHEPTKHEPTKNGLFLKLQ
jgi:hypothetical protein